MRETKYLRYYVIAMTAVLTLCCALAGCGVRDEALVLPVGEASVPGEPEGTDGGNLSGTDGGVPGEAVDGMYAGAGGGISAENSEKEPSVICVYVCGAVREPGVVELPGGSRADDALQAAGGFAGDAETDYVNLAARVEDGQKLYFPTRDEAESLTMTGEDKNPAAAGQEEPVNINTADISQLITLPGIGEARARDIISYREAHGKFQTKEDLKKVSGIKESVYGKLCEKIIAE